METVHASPHFPGIDPFIRDVDIECGTTTVTLSRRERVDFTLMTFITGSAVLSFEPYALMVPRGDTEFRLVADKSLASLYRGAGIRRLYHTWFGRYGEPLSPIVEAMYEFQAVGE